MERGHPWATLISAAGAAGAAVALVYVVGGIVLSLKYEGFGLTGQEAVGLTPREVLLFAGTRSLAIWTLLGLALVLAITRLPDRAVEAIASQLWKPAGLFVVGGLAVLLFLILHVWWPLATLGAVLVIVVTTVHWRARPVRRFLVSAAAIALVAVAYESDRINYHLSWTCVEVAGAVAADRPDGSGPGRQVGQERQRACGILIGQSDRGHYIGSPSFGEQPIDDAPAPYRLLFIPAARVEEAYSEKEALSVIEDRAEVRRERLPSRLWGLRVR